MSCLLTGWDYYQIELFFFPQCLKAFMRLRNKKVTEKQMQTAVGLYMQPRCLSGVI